MSRQTRKKWEDFLPGRLARPACFPTALGGGGRGDLTPAGEGWNSCWPEAVLCPPLCLPPSLSLYLFFHLPLSACFPLASVCPPVRLSPHFRLPPFAFPTSVLTVLSGLCRHTLPLSRPLLLSTSVARRFLRVLSVYLFLRLLLHLIFPSPLSACLFPYLSLSASSFHLCRPPFSMCSGSLPFRRFLSASFFLRLSPSVFLPTFVRPSFPLPLSAHFFPPLSARFFFSLPLAVLHNFAHPPFSAGFPSLSACLSFPLLLSIVLSASSLRPCLPNFPLHPCTRLFLPAFSPSLFSLSLSALPAGKRGGPLDI